MARSAADLSLVLDVMAGPDPIDAGFAYKLELPAARHTAFKDFRVLVIDTDPVLPTDTAVRGTINRLADNLAKAGVRIEREQPAAAGFRGVVAALYAHADLVPGRKLHCRTSMMAPRRPRPRSPKATTAWLPSGYAASRSAIATG